MKSVTIKEIKALYNREKPKFVGLKNSQGAWVVPINSPKIKPQVRMDQIEKEMAKTTVPDGYYFYITKESLNPGAPEYSTEFVKGNPSNLPERSTMAAAGPTIIQARAIDEVWDAKTALDKNTEIIRLTFQVQILQQENADLRSRLTEAEGLLAEEPENPNSDGKEVVEGVKSILEGITPLVDKYFEQRDKEISIKEKAVAGGLMRPVSHPKQTATTRIDGGMPAADPRYEEYFARMAAEATDEEFNEECDYLESVVDADTFNALLDKYDPEETEETNATGT